MNPPHRLAELPLGPLERALVASLERLEPQAPRSVLIAAALCCDALSRGDVCLKLSRLAGQAPWPEHPETLPTHADWLAELQSSALVGHPGDYAPLILENDRLYLARYHAYEQQLADYLIQRMADPLTPDLPQLADSLKRLFAGNTQSPDWQQLAAAQAVRCPLAIISGGPGTGKTTTVVRLLAALLEQPYGEHLSIGLAAPTGKAAARMAEAMRLAKAQLPISEALKARLPDEARTLHRLLGSRGDTPQVRHHPGHPLALDVLVVDEASMVDLALMAKLVAALPPKARLILLGDKDQLAAVEAGAVFAELCEGAGFSPETAQSLNQLTGQPIPSQRPQSCLGEAVVLLTHSHRFAGDSGIGELARRINAGATQDTLNLLHEGRPDLHWQAAPQQKALLERLNRAYLPYLEASRSQDPALAFQAFNRFRALTALREGPLGLNELNAELENRFKYRLSIPSHERWYAGRAIMVRQNDYALGLFNGDIGLCLNSPQGLRVFFEAEQGHRSFSPARLPSHDCAFAMTVHKSQGSEFDHVLLVLPDQPSPLLNRALLYTGITRARLQVELWAKPARLTEAVALKTERAAGLAQRLAKDTYTSARAR